MKCKFDETRECIKAALFDKWKNNKRETAWLVLGVCPYCPVYKSEERELANPEVDKEV